MTTTKPLHTLVLDTGAIIRNEPSVSTLLAQSESLVTVPAIISEIKDAATRSRVETTLQPFLTLRSPNPTSIKFVTDFARRTGDLAVLSKPDIQIIALTYEIECERNGGDWRLRRVPGQKRVNGPPPATHEETASEVEAQGAGGEGEAVHAESFVSELPATVTEASAPLSEPAETSIEVSAESSSEEVQQAATEQRFAVAEPAFSDSPAAVPEPDNDSQDSAAATTQIPTKEGSGNDEQHDGVEVFQQDEADVTNKVAKLDLANADDGMPEGAEPKIDSVQNSASSQDDGESDSEGWITPSNLKKRQAQDAGASTTSDLEPKTMQVGVLTTDFAMQNVILQINLNLLSPSMTRVKHLKTFVLRCHACFQVTKDMTKQFCPKCGKPSLTRVSCSTNANGEFKLHLKKNMQWNTRGDRYSIPKPVHGSANGRMSGGGKGGWGNELILAEDQKEYERASKAEKKQKERSLMDEDYLPSILTGDRGRAGGRVKVGAGRTVNSRKR